MNETTIRCEYQSSELSRNSGEVFSAAETHPIRVTRRDAEPLILMSERESDARRALLEFAAQIIAVTTDDRGTLTERMADRFPWMLSLSSQDRETCVHELVESARASFANNQLHLAAATLRSWQETAAAVAAGLGASPVEWLEDEIIVERP